MSSLSRVAGLLDVRLALDAPELLAEPVRAALAALPSELADRCGVAAIDPALADTAALCAHYHVPLRASANCVVVSGKRAGVLRWAASVVLATTRADVNGVLRRRLDVRKASFAPQDEAGRADHDGVRRHHPVDNPLPPELNSRAVFVVPDSPAVEFGSLRVVGCGVRRFGS